MIEEDRVDDVIIYVIGLLQRLVDKGILEGGRYQLSDKGMGRFRELEDSGFEPTEQEIKAAMHLIQSC